ncbi:CDP-alcohol phosphatidyltransferase family protein [Actinoplanes sp. N902-109]|uniref:CDP-alcohol phosphatidyltransferase family protein n=1 Tax=Actinoplanes sp. (strain N902-109) TaxID=649831 RepID=UPI0003294E5C|nr:CDP-alcohol phosphatidyltransferase family protein [Actinoplanes sp. N902-109]AGL18604.1 phosphatidylglycerophosphate synthase [Actinoplanes sp. N902-109]
MAQRFTLGEIRTRTYKDRDAWWTVWLVDPLASRLVWLVSPVRWITPNGLTMGAFVLGLVAAACFAQGDYKWLVAGAVVFHLSFVLDCMDGKIARLKGTGSVFGAWLDYVFDRLRVLVCAVALMGGQYAKTDNIHYLWLAGVIIFLDMFRYLNALQMGKVKNDMRRRLEAAQGEGAARPLFVEETDAEHPVGVGSVATAVDSHGEERPVVDVYGDFRSKFGAFVKVRNALVRQRIRAHLFSGIEFQMFVFIVGPLTNQIAVFTILSAVLLAAFELLLIYKLYTATRSYTRKMAQIGVTSEAQAEAVAAAAGVEEVEQVVDTEQLDGVARPAAVAHL